jgi:ubiquinone/menaquinone biosynthesis C-methylase UbiE
MRALPFRDAGLDGVTSLFTSFGYFSLDDDRRALEEAGRVLRPGGFHLLDFLNRRRVLSHPNPESERTSGDYRIRERRRLEGHDRRIVKEVTVLSTTGEEPLAKFEESVNLYRPEELRRLLAGVGLSVHREWGEYTGTPFDEDESSRHVFLSVKEGG